MGDKYAAYKLGLIYHDGRCGVAVNKTEALKWYLVAADLGQPYAQDKVDALEAELAAETAA